MSARLRGGRLLIAIAGAVVLLLIASRAAVNLWVEALWQGEVGYLGVFLRRVAWVWGIRLLIAVAVTTLLFFNLRVVARSLGSLQIRRRFGNLEIAERLPGRYLTGGILLLSALLGAWFGATVPEGIATSALFQMVAPAWGRSDPFLGLDLTFYAFGLPLIRNAITFALVVVFLVFTVVVSGYATTGTLRFGEGGVIMTEGARRHLGLLVGGFMALVSVRLVVGMPLLLLDGSSDVQGIFGYTDHRARLRMLPLQALMTAAGAAGVLFGTWRNRLVPVIGGVAAAVLATIGLGQLYPALVQRFQVVPNELGREAPYIEHNLAFTRLGFGLDQLDRSRFPARAGPDVDWDEAARQLRGLPVWTRATLLTTFREVEARFGYYEFRDVAMDRYPGPDGRQVPVALAVREVDPGAIEEPNWQNLHLRERYVAGSGAVAVAAAGRTPEGSPRTYLRGLPPEFVGGDAPPGLALERSAIFVGSRVQPPYALIRPSESAYTGLDGSPGRAGADFPRGIGVGGPVRKLLLAWYLREANVLFSSEVRTDSRLVLRRGAVERARAIAPFLRFPEAPYPVVAHGRIVWILEGFTATRSFPLSRPFDLEFRSPVSYVRSSAKVTVDAVTGEVAFYALPTPDPLRDTYARAFPGLFRPLDDMPEVLRAHLRYPRVLLTRQAEVLLAYHQETPATFFGQQDVWDLPEEQSEGTTTVPYEPEYGLLRFPGDEVERFQIVMSFVPRGRQNLTALLSALIEDDGRYGLRLFDVPVENQVPGPRQVEALVEQDPIISQQFSLWRTGGSDVWTGHLHLVPVGERIVYMEPVFLAATADAIPELRRFVMSDGRRVVMGESLDGALALLSGREVGGAEGVDASGDPAGAGIEVPREALELLDLAEARLRAGDWAGFGEALARLRALLGGGGAGAGSG